jgi:hypothetical protein
LNNGGRDPKEILEAYDTNSLSLYGNATHLAPWYSRLGFQTEPFYATLRSLTPDGGIVPLIAFVVEKVRPLIINVVSIEVTFLLGTGLPCRLLRVHSGIKPNTKETGRAAL